MNLRNAEMLYTFFPQKFVPVNEEEQGLVCVCVCVRVRVRERERVREGGGGLGSTEDAVICVL